MRFLLLDHQLELVDHFYRNKARKHVWHCSRRIGKSSAALVLALQAGISRKNAIIRYGAATQKDVKEIVHPLMTRLTETAPAHIKPLWRQSEGKYLFPSTGSQMVVSGLDEGRADSLRGTGMDLGIIDEAAFVTDLEYVISSVLMPQCLTTDGRILIASTSPRSSSHPFVAYMREAERSKSCIRKRITEDSRPEVIARLPEWIEEAGGVDSTTWKREYLCEIITDEETAIVPEFSRPEVRSRVVQEVEIPPHLTAYTVIDLGYVDHTAAVFGFVDFKRGKKVILDCLILQRKDSKHIADAVLAKEKEVWGSDPSGHCLRTPRRFADGQPLAIADFNSLHNLSVNKLDNSDLQAQVNTLRLDVVSAVLQIHPRCIPLTQQLHDGVWDSSFKRFDRSIVHGHYDLLATCMYFVRYANLKENPYPQDWGYDPSTHLIKKSPEMNESARAIKSAFKLK